MWVYLLGLVVGIMLARLIYPAVAIMVAREVIKARIRAVLAEEREAADLDHGLPVEGV